MPVLGLLGRWVLAAPPLYSASLAPVPAKVFLAVARPLVFMAQDRVWW